MSDTTADAAGADRSAPDAEMTDEQLWSDIEATEKDIEPNPDADDIHEVITDEDEGADDAPPDKPDDDEDPKPSDADDGAPDGMDREALEAQNKRLLHSLKSEQGRTAGSRREIERLRDQISSAPTAQRDEKDDAHLKEQREKLDASREEYGDVIGPLADTIKDLEARLDQQSAKDVATHQQNQSRYNDLVSEEVAVFKAEHSDGFETIIEHREVFDAWIDDQPRAMRDIYAENQQDIVDGTQAAYLVTEFKQALLGETDDPTPANPETERLQSRRQRQLAGGRSIRGSKTQSVSSRPAKDSNDDQAHWDYFERQDKRKR